MFTIFVQSKKGGMDRLLDGTGGYSNLDRTHDLLPEKFLLATEGCNCPGVDLGSWTRSERYAHDIMQVQGARQEGGGWREEKREREKRPKRKMKDKDRKYEDEDEDEGGGKKKKNEK